MELVSTSFSGDFFFQFLIPEFFHSLGIASYMREQVGPSSKILTSLKALTDFMKERDDEVIVGFFENESDKLLEQYLEANNDIRNDYSFAHTFDPAAKKHFGIKGSSIVLFHPEQFRSKFEDKHIVFKVRGFGLGVESLRTSGSYFCFLF